MYFLKRHAEKKLSPFVNLANLTKKREEPILKIVHCIRDLVYGDKARANDLKTMVKSEDPAYRKIFEAVNWIEPSKKTTVKAKAKK